MLSLRPNSRQIPRHADYTANKDYDDLMYAYLQSISKEDKEGYRYVKSSDASATKLGEVLGITRQTAAKRLKGLQALLLVGEKKNARYELPQLAPELAILVPLDVLEKLISFKKQHLISLYVYVMWRYFQNNQEQFTFQLNTIKEQIGISSGTYSNSNIISDSMTILNDLCLVKYRQANIVDENGQGFKTRQYIYWVENRFEHDKNVRIL